MRGLPLPRYACRLLGGVDSVTTIDDKMERFSSCSRASEPLVTMVRPLALPL